MSNLSNAYLCYPSVNLRTVTGNSSFAVTARKMVYLVGKLSGRLFTVEDSSWLVTEPSDGTEELVFLSLGYMYNTYQMYLYPEHPMYAFRDGVFKNLNEIACDAHVMASEATAATIENSAAITTLQDQISMAVSKTTYDSDQHAIDVRMSNVEQSASAFKVEITKTVTDSVSAVNSNVQSVSQDLNGFRSTVQGYMAFDGDKLTLGKTGNSFKTEITNTEMAFTQNSEKVAYISNSDMYITRARVTDTLSVGTTSNGYFDFVTLPGGLALKWRTAQS